MPWAFRSEPSRLITAHAGRSEQRGSHQTTSSDKIVQAAVVAIPPH